MKRLSMLTATATLLAGGVANADDLKRIIQLLVRDLPHALCSLPTTY
jgi:hypothetical protein